MNGLEYLSMEIKLYSLGTGEPKMAVEQQMIQLPEGRMEARETVLNWGKMRGWVPVGGAVPQNCPFSWSPVWAWACLVFPGGA